MAAPVGNSLDFTTSINEIVNEKFSENHVHVLQSFTTALRAQEYRDSIAEGVFVSLMQVLSKLSEELQAAGGEEHDTESVPLCLRMTAECFRGQRNACVQSARNQSLLRELGFIDVSLRILGMLQKLRIENTDSTFQALRCGIQFLGNLAVGNQACKDDIWRLSFPDLILELLSVSDEKAVGYASMVLHTCLDEHKVEQLAQLKHIQLALKVMELCRTQPELDWTVLIATQHFLKSSTLVENMYSEISHQERVTLLELISAQLGEEASEDCGIPPGVARFLASCFRERCGAVLTLATGSAADDEEALTVISLLDVLCEMTSDHRQFMFLQDFPDLLKTTVELLEQVHTLGKTSKNVFSASQNFSSFSHGGDGSSSSPSVSFKAHLVRLIGNLCCGNTNNQNKVRELEGIPLILDNCSIDSNNPLAVISQWAIFTIRNLLEHNVENQELVAALERRGVANGSALRDLGFRVEERDGSLLLKPVNKDA